MDKPQQRQDLHLLLDQFQMGKRLSLVLSHTTEHTLTPLGLPGLYLWDLKTWVHRIWRLAAFVVSAHRTQHGRGIRRVQKLAHPYDGVLWSSLKCILLRIPTILFPVHDWKYQLSETVGRLLGASSLEREWSMSTSTSSAVSSAVNVDCGSVTPHL